MKSNHPAGDAYMLTALIQEQQDYARKYLQLITANESGLRYPSPSGTVFNPTKPSLIFRHGILPLDRCVRGKRPVPVTPGQRGPRRWKRA